MKHRLALVAALAGAFASGWLAMTLAAPVSTGGPMNLGPLLELILFLLAYALARLGCLGADPHRRWLLLLLALAVGAPTLWNFYWYPPIADGAYFMVRYGQGFIGDSHAPAGFDMYLLLFATALHPAMTASSLGRSRRWRWSLLPASVVWAYLVVELGSLALYRLPL